METPTVSQPSASPEEAGTPLEGARAGAPQAGTPGTGQAPLGAPRAGPYAPPRYPPQPYSPYASYPPAPLPRRNSRGWILGGVVAALVLIGLVVALLIALVGGLALNGLWTTHTSVSSRAFRVDGTPTLVVTNASGNVSVVAGDASTVTVQTTMRARVADSGWAQRAFDSMNVAFTQQGNRITATSTFSPGLMVGIAQGRSIDYVITAPAGSSVQADVSAGNVDVSNTTGALTLTTSAGNITTSNTGFAAGSTLRTSAGNVIANGYLMSGGSLRVGVSAGNATIGLPASTATRLDASVNTGNLTITGFPVQVTSSGLIGHRATGDTGPNPQGSVTVTVSTGNVTITAR